MNGKPRIVEQVYLGPRDRFLEETKAAYTRGQAPGPTPLKRLQSREFGASAYLWNWAERLGLAEIVDRHVPPPPRRRRTQLSVGQYLVLTAVNRAVAPRSKRSCFLALVLLAILRLQLHRAGCSMSVDRAVRRLKDIDETLVIYTNGAADRALTELAETQSEVARAVGLLQLADQLGTTVLERDQVT